MKKILFASTALVAFTGAAAADVALSGRAEMGIFNPAGAGDWQFFTDIDVTFTMSGETDNGLTFGASVDLDEGGAGSPAVANNADDGGATIFISGSFGTVTMGDTDGALDWALTEAGNVGNPGSIADDETAHGGYLGSYLDGGAFTGAAAPAATRAGDGQILRWDYSFGDFGVAVSLEDDNGTAGPNASIGYAIGLKYDLAITGGTVSFGIGHQVAANNGAAFVAPLNPAVKQKASGISISAALDNGFSAGIVYTDMSNLGVDKHVGVGLGYTSGPISVHANYGKFSADTTTVPGSVDTTGYGLSAAYDLGGGAVIHAGYGSSKPTGGATTKSASLGLGLSF